MLVGEPRRRGGNFTRFRCRSSGEYNHTRHRTGGVDNQGHRSPAGCGSKGRPALLVGRAARFHHTSNEKPDRWSGRVLNKRINTSNVDLSRRRRVCKRKSVCHEFEPFFSRLEPDEARYGCDSVVEQVISLLEKERPPNPKSWADKQLRNGVTQFLILRGHPLEDLIKAQRPASRRKRRSQASSVDLVTEDLVAMQFANAHSGAFRYCHDAGSWHECNGSYSIKDRLGRVSDIVRGLAREMSRGEEPKVRYATRQSQLRVRRRAARAHRRTPRGHI